LPEVALFPVQAPDAAQPVAFEDDHVSREVPPLVTEVGFALKLTVGAPGGGGPAGVTFTVTERLVVPPAPVHASVKVLV
jgi:hypothetical protein